MDKDKSEPDCQSDDISKLREALKISNAPIVDISSGLESKKGIKSNKKIEKFLELVNKIKNEE